MSLETYTTRGTATTYDMPYTGHISVGRMSTKKAKTHFNSKPIEQIVNAGIVSSRIALFGNRGSPAFNDHDQLLCKNINVYYVDPIISGYDNPPELCQYNYSIIIDALEYIPELMARANLIKESLATLRNDDGCVIMVTKSPEMVNNFAEEKKYADTGNGFLISNKKSILNGFTIRGIGAKELITTARFAGARAAETIEEVETDMVCVRAYLM